MTSLRRYARILCRADHQADDLVQGALLRAYERRGTFRNGSDLRVWLMAILHNHFIDQLRSAKASAMRDRDWAEMNLGFSLPEGEHVVRLQQLRAAFLLLPIDQREALHLMAVEGLSVAKIAEILDIPAGTVMSRIGRARSALRKFEDGDFVATKIHSKQPKLKLLRGQDGT